jgi:hypothetical protein
MSEVAILIAGVGLVWAGALALYPHPIDWDRDD